MGDVSYDECQNLLDLTAVAQAEDLNRFEPLHLNTDKLSDENCLFREISFCIYASEDFHDEIREKVIQKIGSRWGLLKDIAILKESLVYKECEI
ncbi:hypothetical protein AVEN_7170-1 [Araneus ventricosus]|uniref:OTU domain-containing protein n=1 Tax=Araneus ventricosus TaxID=182803 RepID=A0A4Y2GQZ2_ARAVE|nr:hypothetical protein AVEN_7170-1 [Araneus ventricosus]